MNKWDSRLMISLVTAPASEPVTTSGAKTHLRVDTSDDDTYIGTLITVARRYLEETYGLAIINQTWDQWLNWFPDEIELARPPLSSVTSITYSDTDGDSQTLASGVYTVDSDTRPGRVYEAYDQTWPSVQAIPKAIKVRFVGGFAATASGVPDDIKQAMLLMIGHLYENREATSDLTIKDVPIAIDALMAPYAYRAYE